LENSPPLNSIEAFVALLPHSFLEAGLIGKLVMALLAFASVWSWVLIGEGLFALIRLKRAAKRDEAGDASHLIAPILAAGRQAAELAIQQESPSELRQRIVEAMNRKAQVLLAHAEAGLPNLAVIASVAPFVGLFGTVYGIMTSFAGIAEAKDTSLATVAPGIAEALAATAWGLAAAIPASVAYNRLGAALARAGLGLAHLIEERAVEIVAARRKSGPLKEVA
jgi:biopolymer transport protein ExbB/TolQ